MHYFILLPLLSPAVAFSSTTITNDAVTVTESAATRTLTLEGMTQPTIVTIPEMTLTAPATTFTTLIQPSYCQGSDENNCEDIELVATEITTLPAAKVTQIENLVDQYYSTYAPPGGQGRPQLFAIYEELAQYFPQDTPEQKRVLEQIEQELYPFQASSVIDKGFSALAPIPTLLADAKAWIEQVRSYYAAPFLYEASVVSKELSLTAAAPTWLSYVAAAAATQTGGVGGASGPVSTGTATGTQGTTGTAVSSHNAANPTSINSLLMNACAVAAGIAGVMNL